MIYSNDKISIAKRCYNFLRLVSLYKKSNGIYHKGKIFYVSKSSVIGTIATLLLLISYCHYAYHQFGKVIGIQ